jgi:hypothetical protein
MLRSSGARGLTNVKAKDISLRWSESYKHLAPRERNHSSLDLRFVALQTLIHLN